jgi:elongation factor P
MAVKAIDLRRGGAVSFKNGIWVCMDNQKVAKGNWRSYQVIQLKNVQTGQLIEDRFRTDEQFDEAFLERKQMEYSYTNGNKLIVMDPVTFEEVELPAEMIGNLIVYLTPNLPLEVVLVEGKPVTIDLPNTVDLRTPTRRPRSRAPRPPTNSKTPSATAGRRFACRRSSKTARSSAWTREPANTSAAREAGWG